MVVDFESFEARVIRDGEPIEGGPALFEGSLEMTRAYLARLDDEQREGLSVWTPGHVFTIEKFEAEIPGREHDPD